MKGNAGDTIVKKIDLSPELVRVALYIRVSGEEQKIKGLSLEAQQERLEAYARERGWVIVGIYIDAAKTARKNIHKRTDFQRMMDSVKRDEVDILLFCRLDRWFVPWQIILKSWKFWKRTTATGKPLMKNMTPQPQTGVCILT